ncbi:DNA mismatch repair protein MSH6 [Tripterygium wilfordii]|uniref:DNA mismatch repair protein n=1 Tax=Tripterygium wilfordii TaxID=458696 RepID=A0A7J7D5C1_TRIWF|nr:DNA mismatch repair protein MSH6-like [Tripterygium wilfordii]KAF5741530.1 DNA mismatch repair protein MSH6 [Tripterygium wilfordii]
MAPSRRQSNGRSSLVNQQRQITAFFSKSATPSPSPSPVISKQTSKLNPKPNPSPTRSPSPHPATPSPVQSKPKKPLLVVGGTTLAPNMSYGEEVVDKRIKVYWPLDKVWYEGLVKSFDEESGKHLVQYEDAEEELLDLRKEKIQWIEDSAKRLKRLRRGSSLACEKKLLLEEEEEQVVGDLEDKSDDSSDEDWGKKNAEKELSKNDDDDTDLIDEEDEIEVKKSRKRKVSGDEKLVYGKKSKSNGIASKGGLKVSGVEPVNNAENGKASNGFVDDATERFGIREATKFRFLEIDRRDANRRRPGDENYDPKTLYLPSDFLKKLSGGQRQWWDFKSKHMDKVLFFKMGKFYELFEMDAHIGAKELDLQYMKGEQPHCGFPERNFSMNVEKLARKGYRVLVIEQTETPEQLELRRKEKGSKDKVVKREICAVVTKGTLAEGELTSANPDASYLITVTESFQSLRNQGGEKIFGVCAVDAATSKVVLGQFRDDSECSSLCCLLSQLRPVEIIKPAKMLSPETDKAIVRHSRNPLVNELAPVVEFWDAEKTVHEIKTLYKRISVQPASGSLVESDSCSMDMHTEEPLDHLPDILLELISAGEDGTLALSALGGTLYYLRQAFLDETLLRFAKFESLPCCNFRDIAQKPCMILDAAALENLEIFENSRNGDPSGTLYAQLNHCVTAFGKRLLKTWLATPLYHLESIRERQDAVAGLRGVNQAYALEFRKALSRLPDMERLLAKIFAGCEANGRNANKVILYEDAAKKRLQEFISALRGCELMAQACGSLVVILENSDSEQLKNLLTPGKGFPDILPNLRHFKDAFDWGEANSAGRIIPHEGVDIEYDSACRKVREIEFSLTENLKQQRELLGDSSVSYVTVGKETYLLELPESLRGSVPRDYELRSSKKGFFRYWTPNIKKLLGELSQAESEKESSLKSILQRLVRSFCKHHEKWRQLVSTTAELDVLISIAIASDFYEGPTCRPIILDSSGSKEVPKLFARGLGHPVLKSDSLGKGAFVPNDISLGGSGHASFILLTGPNMGGKSTLLRQVCLAVILAQMGADVPAESFELSPVDRIFVRMGAKDHIMSGQSTFLTELSETSLMLSSATCNSLVTLDELGRGTSTSDGQAIAESVLDHFVHKVQCRGMFSTHYHRLALDYQKDPNVSLCHMACQVGSGDTGVEEVTFLYRLTPGACPKSYGVNVARLAGLPDSVLQKAADKSREFEALYGRSGEVSKDRLLMQSCCDEIVVFSQKLNNFMSNLSCKSAEKIDMACLTTLQHRARMILQPD